MMATVKTLSTRFISVAMFVALANVGLSRSAVLLAFVAIGLLATHFPDKNSSHDISLYPLLPISVSLSPPLSLSL